jgi:NitT/TauT family transport system permease protein
MPNFPRIFAKNEAARWPIPNYWDLIALIFVLTIICLLCWGAKEMVGQYHPGQELPVSLNPIYLPYYALRSVMRMLIALMCSLIFTFIYGTLAAKSRNAERILIPFVDILQSVPVLGFLPIGMVIFVVLFKGSLLGPECAAIFAIFVAQVWNMTLSFYQSLKTVPNDFCEAARMFQLSPWQRFWRMDVPFAMPGLLWNMMLSMSGSWVFLVASEAITIANQTVTLPGIGSYIALAISTANAWAIVYAIIMMAVVIIAYDQLLFRPLVAWADKFKAEEAGSDEESESWLLYIFQSTRFFQFIGGFLANFGDAIVNFAPFRTKHRKKAYKTHDRFRLAMNVFWHLVLVFFLISAVMILFRFIFTTVSLGEAKHVAYLGFLTALRVMAVILLSSIIWVPIGVWIGLHPKASKIIQPLAQMLAAFPANLLFPVVAIMIVKYSLNVNIWTSPLMILGAQWYILFNVIAGTIALPQNLQQAVNTLNVTGWLWWRRFILPGIFPYYITGVITAAGGAWNISIIAEVVNWGNTHLKAEGVGAYVTQVYNQGDFPRLALGVVVMSLYVLLINRLFWRPLYNLAHEKFIIR